MEKEVNIVSGRSLWGIAVLDADNRVLGEVSDVMVDMASGYVLYVILRLHPPAGDSNALYPVPWGALELDTVEGVPVIRFDATQDRLAHAPSFHRHMWPDLASAEWRLALHNHYSVPAYWHEMSNGTT
jgi:sporulation protein YlmC with PRC-barrel domain